MIRKDAKDIQRDILERERLLLKEGCLSKAIPGFLLHREGDKAAALRGHCAHLLAFAGSGVNCIKMF